MTPEGNSVSGDPRPPREPDQGGKECEFVAAFERLADRVDGRYAFDQLVRVKVMRKEA